MYIQITSHHITSHGIFHSFKRIVIISIKEVLSLHISFPCSASLLIFYTVVQCSCHFSCHVMPCLQERVARTDWDTQSLMEWISTWSALIWSIEIRRKSAHSNRLELLHYIFQSQSLIEWSMSTNLRFMSAINPTEIWHLNIQYSKSIIS